MSKVDVRLGNQLTVEGYKLLETPALYTYAELLEQIVDVPVQVFKTHKKLPDTNEAIVMKRYLTKRIALMKNKKNKMVSRKISYQWYDQKTQTEKGLYAVLGYICNVGKKEFDDKVIRGTVVRVKKITEENCRLIEGLNLLMFLVKYTTYQKEVEDYLIREKIFLEDMEPFIDKYPKSILKVFSKLFR